MTDAPFEWESAPIMHSDGTWTNQPLSSPFSSGDGIGAYAVMPHSGALYFNELYSCTTPGCYFRSVSQYDFQRHGQTWNSISSSTTPGPGQCMLFDPTYNDPVSADSHAYVSIRNEDVAPMDTGADSEPTSIQQQQPMTRARPYGELSNAGILTTIPALNVETLETLVEEGSSGIAIDEVGRTDEKPFVCSQEDCGASFKRSSDLSRHRKKHLPRTLHCLEPGCRFRGANGFYRRDKLVHHQTNKHHLGLRHARWGFSLLQLANGDILEAVLPLDQLDDYDKIQLKLATQDFKAIKTDAKTFQDVRIRVIRASLLSKWLDKVANINVDEKALFHFTPDEQERWRQCKGERWERYQEFWS